MPRELVQSAVQPSLFPGDGMHFAVRGGATFSPDRIYRYSLWRIWDDDLGNVAFICLNPSTADETQDDPTIRRCIGFAKAWGYGGIYILNIFALRSTDPKKLRLVDDPIGPENDRYIPQEAGECEITVAAWGVWGGLYERGRDVKERLYEGAGISLHHLGLTKHWFPRHPLYLPGSVRPVKW